MPENNIINKKKELLLTDFKEAWQHYRHMENMRLHLLGFLVTLYLTIIAGLSVFSEDIVRSKLHICAIIFSLIVFIIIGTFVYTCIRKWGPVMFHYEKVITFIRKEIYDSDFERLNNYINLRKDNDVKKKSPKGTIQKNSERVVLFLLILPVIALIFFVVFLFINWTSLPWIYESRPIIEEIIDLINHYL